MSIEKRFEIGRYCDERYDYECQEYNLRLWLHQLIEIWQGASHSPQYQSEFYESLFQNIEATKAEIEFGYYFTFDALSLYDENGKINFEVSKCLPLLIIIANRVFGFEVNPPINKNLPRDKIAWTKSKIVFEAQRTLTDPNQVEFDSIQAPLLVSTRFIWSCWNYFQEWA